MEEQLADAHEENSRLAAETEDLSEQLAIAREEHAAYRLNVVDHFSGTSDLLRDLPVPEIAEPAAEPEREEEVAPYESAESGAVDEDSERNAPPLSP